MGTRWPKGTSGNPAGRPAGSRNKSTIFFEELFAGEGEALTRKAIQLGLKGDTTALRLCMDRIAPPRRERLVEFPLPKITKPDEAAAATASILTAVSEGQISPGEAETLMRLVQTHVEVLTTDDLARRIAGLEEVTKKLQTWPDGTNSPTSSAPVNEQGPAPEAPSEDESQPEEQSEGTEKVTVVDPQTEPPAQPTPESGTAKQAAQQKRVPETTSNIPRNSSWMNG